MWSPLACPVCNLPARPSVQPISPRKIHVFHLETRPSSPPGLPFSVIPSYEIYFIWMTNSSFYLNCVRPGASVIISYNQCYAWRAWTASTQSFTLLRKQVTIEITWWNHSIPCSCHLHISAILSEHPIRDMLCMQHCSYWVFATAYHFTMTLTCTNQTSFCVACTWYCFHILVTVPFCCDQMARAACA